MGILDIRILKVYLICSSIVAIEVHIRDWLFFHTQAILAKFVSPFTTWSYLPSISSLNSSSFPSSLARKSFLCLTAHGYSASFELINTTIYSLSSCSIQSRKVFWLAARFQNFVILISVYDAREALSNQGLRSICFAVRYKCGCDGTDHVGQIVSRLYEFSNLWDSRDEVRTWRTWTKIASFQQTDPDIPVPSLHLLHDPPALGMEIFNNSSQV